MSRVSVEDRRERLDEEGGVNQKGGTGQEERSKGVVTI